MVAENLDYPAVRDPAARALHHHALKFRLQSGQPRKAAFNLGQLCPCDGIGGGAGLVGFVRQAQEVADCLEREAKVACVTDERQPVERLVSVEPLVPGAAFGLGQEADLLVVADGRHLHPRVLSQFSDGQHQIPLEPIVARDTRFPIR